MKHWKVRLRERCKFIASDMQKRFSYRFVPCYSDISYATQDGKGGYEVRAKPPVGYITMAVYCHEVGHVLFDDWTSEPSKTSKLYSEVRAWGFARKMFDEYDLDWVASVSALVKTCLGSYVTLESSAAEEVPEGGRAFDIIEALHVLQKAGV